VIDQKQAQFRQLGLSRRVIPSALVLLVAGICWIVWPRQSAIVGPRSRALPGSLVPRDVYAGSPYKNARPDVAYAGDAACAGCHRQISEAYRSHPMGRSLAPVSDTKGGLPADRGKGVAFEHKGVQYTIEHRDGKVFHKAARRNADGSLFAEIEAEVGFSLGSQKRGAAYLIERDGFVFQSPIAWFAQERRWDISPGYGEFGSLPSFERPIQADCLFCHTNQFVAVPGTRNRYEPPIFRGHAIGCERCHGPGELHVKAGWGATDTDDTIVNPAKLSAPLRDSVCQQCHLQGSLRFARAGREALDYRPGLPLHRFLAVFLMKKESQGKFDAVGHSEQMESSRCFAASQGQLGCISCHDPHRLPAAASKVAYYRERCLQCHQKNGCTVPLDKRQAEGRADDCVHCHMPRPAITNIPHTAATDHRIKRRATSSVPEKPREATGQPEESPLTDYHWMLMSADEQREAARDMGVALAWAARILRLTPRVAGLAATQSLALLEAAVRDRPDDLTARESLGHALAIVGRPEDALRAFEGILAIEPRRELALRAAGRVLTELKRPVLAREMLQKAIAVDPWQSDYHLALAMVCGQMDDWSAAIAACREALSKNPELLDARSLLVQCYLRAGETKKADAEFQVMLRLFPASREAWQQWYEPQKLASPRDSKMIAPRKP
jgi:Flp pilus assembly protein TadD